MNSSSSSEDNVQRGNTRTITNLEGASDILNTLEEIMCNIKHSHSY
jgi:hypothetical protein